MRVGTAIAVALLSGTAFVMAPAGSIAAVDKVLLKVQEATAAMLRGRYDQAVTLYDEVLQDASLSKTRQAGIYNDRGVAKWRQQNLDDALADFALAIAASPDYAPVYNNRGNVLMELERYEEAYRDFDKALALRPGFGAAYNNRGNANQQLKRFAAAAEDFRKAVELMPSNAVPYNGRGKAQAALGHPFTALRYLNRAITLNGQYIAAYENRARVYAHLERYDDAVSDLDRVLSTNPENVDLYIRRGQAHARSRKTQQALRDFTKALDLDPDNAEALVGRAVQNIERKRHDLALEDLSQAISIDPEMPDAYYHRAMAQVALNDVDAAQKNLEQAIKLDPAYAEAYVLRATLNEKAGAMEAATADFRKALELDPFAQEARSGFERVSGETAVSVAAPIGEPVSGWSVYAPAAGRFVAVHERYPKLRVFLEMHGEGQAEILEWTPLRDALNGIGLLRYRAGNVQGQAYEYVAILDLNASKVVAIEPYLWGDRRSTWEWTQNAVTVTDPETVTSFYELRRPRPVAPPTVAATDDPWFYFGEQQPRERRYRDRRPPPNLFDWLFR